MAKPSRRRRGVTTIEDVARAAGVSAMTVSRVINHGQNVRETTRASVLEAIERLMVGGADLIVLDLNMPDMHGLDVLGFVRGHAAFASLPVIVLTTRGDERSRESALRAGATLFRTKPFTPESLAADARAVMATTARGNR